MANDIQFPNLADIYSNVESIKNSRLVNAQNKMVLANQERKQASNQAAAPFLKNRDYAGAANVAYDAGDVESGQGFDDRATKSLSTIIEVQKEIAPIFYQASQIADPTTRKQVVQNAISEYGRNMESVDPGWTERAMSMYAEANPDALKAGAAKGMSLHDQAVERYKLISTTSGFKRVDMIGNTAEDIGGSQLMAPNASPDLQYQMQKAKEAPKGVDVTDETGATYRAPQEQANPAFAPQGNNFGNIRPQGQSTGFQKFSTPEEGLSAIDKNLQAYGSKGINTLQGVISRWAPPNENDTARLIAEASKRLGINPNQPIDLNNPAVRQAVSTAIMYQEQGPKGIFGVVKSPGIAQQEQLKANIKTQQAVEQQKALTEGKKETAGVNMNTLLNQKFDGENIESLINKATGSGMGAQLDAAGRYVGIATEGAKANSKLKTLSGWLVSNIPRMEGPQSNFDVQNYQQMAGAIADPDTTKEEKIAAYNTIKQIVAKYSEGDQKPAKKEDLSDDDLINFYSR